VKSIKGGVSTVHIQHKTTIVIMHPRGDREFEQAKGDTKATGGKISDASSDAAEKTKRGAYETKGATQEKASTAGKSVKDTAQQAGEKIKEGAQKVKETTASGVHKTTGAMKSGTEKVTGK
jgi:hypothetical protein